MRTFVVAVVLLVVLGALSSAHEAGHHPHLVIDTDGGLDDLVALAMALQHADARLVSVVAVDGATRGDVCLETLERMLHRFNRSDVALHGPAKQSAPVTDPPFRAGAERLVRRLLSEPAPRCRRDFSPGAYVAKGRKTVILALGPLRNLAAALEESPEIRDGIEKVIASGDPKSGWNARLDPDALRSVLSSGLPVEFVIPGTHGVKPERWDERVRGRDTTIGATFLSRLLADEVIGTHYRTQLGPFHDEIAFLYYVSARRFSAEKDRENVLAPSGRAVMHRRFFEAFQRGRHARRFTVFGDRPWRSGPFREDVRERREAIIEKNGEEEWFAQVLLNEIHGHLGAYSVIGVKMGIRGAEILNAPLHAMRVISHIPPGPPASCLNDGLLVATGSTPGRALLTHEVRPDAGTSATFTYNGRKVTLRLRDDRRGRIRQTISGLLKKHGLEDREYWKGVRLLGLEIWQDWHRLDLFTVVPPPREPR